jgi:transketolase C-terminal domain/subunit
MVRTQLCHGKANVKLMGACAGLSDSFDGPTHNSISDIAFAVCCLASREAGFITAETMNVNGSTLRD